MQLAFDLRINREHRSSAWKRECVGMKMPRRIAMQDAAQAEAARLILSDPEKHGPGLVEWATRYLARVGG